MPPPDFVPAPAKHPKIDDAVKTTAPNVKITKRKKPVEKNMYEQRKEDELASIPVQKQVNFADDNAPCASTTTTTHTLSDSESEDEEEDNNKNTTKNGSDSESSGEESGDEDASVSGDESSDDDDEDDGKSGSGSDSNSDDDE